MLKKFSIAGALIKFRLNLVRDTAEINAFDEYLLLFMLLIVPTDIQVYRLTSVR